MKSYKKDPELKKDRDNGDRRPITRPSIIRLALLSHGGSRRPTARDGGSSHDQGPASDDKKGLHDTSNRPGKAIAGGAFSRPLINLFVHLRVDLNSC
jgi:hypothetical protein